VIKRGRSMNNEKVQHKLDDILNKLKGGKLTPQEAHEAMKPLNELIYEATKKMQENPQPQKKS